MAWQRSRLYTAWCNMKGRCYRKSMKGYENYGGRENRVQSKQFENGISPKWRKIQRLYLESRKVW